MYLGFVNDTTLSGLYSGAVAVIFLSKYEGFGLPMIEAFKLGCPVIINSKCDVLTEQAEGAAIIVRDDQSKPELTVILDTLLDREKRRDLSARMARVAAKYEWATCVRSYMDLVLEEASRLS